MSAIRLCDIKDKFFFTHFYYDRETGEIGNELETLLPDASGAIIKIPCYSMAFVRQQFLRKLSEEKALDLAEYKLGGYPEFSLYAFPDTKEVETLYIAASHRLCEDYQLEREFWDFCEECTYQFAREWCEKNNISYMES